MGQLDSPATLVARFLKSNNYQQTLDAFLCEANLPQDAGSASSKNAITIEQLISEKNTYDRSQSFERVEVHTPHRESWSLPAPSAAYQIPALSNAANVLHVSVEDVIGETSAERHLIASSANKLLLSVPSSDPQRASTSVFLNHISPILSWIVIRSFLLITSSMSGHVTMYDLRGMKQLWSQQNHQKYVVAIAQKQDAGGIWLATAAWDAKVLLYRFTNSQLGRLADGTLVNLDLRPIASIMLQSNPESVVFVEHPELQHPVLLLSRRDSTFLYYYAIPSDLEKSTSSTPDPFEPKTLPSLPLLGRQNLAPHSNAWIAFTPSALALHPKDPSLIAIATSHMPHLKLIVARLLLPPPDALTSDVEISVTAPPAFDATTGPIINPAQAAEARRLLAIQDREDAAILVQVSTMAPQSAYSTPALAWRPDATGVWVNGDDGVVRGVEAKTGKIVSVLQGGHEPGSKVRCLWAGMFGGRELVVSGGFDRNVIVWECDNGERK